MVVGSPVFELISVQYIRVFFSPVQLFHTFEPDLASAPYCSQLTQLFPRVKSGTSFTITPHNQPPIPNLTSPTPTLISHHSLEPRTSLSPTATPNPLRSGHLCHTLTQTHLIPRVLIRFPRVPSSSLSQPAGTRAGAYMKALLSPAPNHRASSSPLPFPNIFLPSPPPPPGRERQYVAGRRVPRELRVCLCTCLEK